MDNMNVTLTELASNSDISEDWGNEQAKGFVAGTFYTIFNSPQTWVEYIQRSKKNKLKLLLGDKTIETSEIENNKIWNLIIKDINGRTTNRFHIGTFNNVWMIFSEKKSNLKILENLIKYSNGICHAWVSPAQMSDIINEYAKIGTLQAVSKAPSFKIPKRAPIPAKVREELPEAFFKKMSATVQFWAPRELISTDNPFYYDEFRISPAYLNRITKLIFQTKFDNPGKSKLSVENESIVTHEKGMPKATEKVFNSVFHLSSSWIENLRGCIPEFDIRYDDRRRNFKSLL